MIAQHVLENYQHLATSWMSGPSGMLLLYWHNAGRTVSWHGLVEGELIIGSIVRVELGL